VTGLAVAGAALAAASPAASLASIIAAARAQRSVHYASASSDAGVHLGFVGDVSASTGRQQITFDKGGRTGHVTVIVAAGSAYIRGDAFTLVNYLDFGPRQGATYANVWMRIPQADPVYAAVAQDVTLSSVIGELGVSGPLSVLAPARMEGRSVFGLRNVAKSASGTTVVAVYARAVGPPLPVREAITHGSTRFSMTFSRWNEPITFGAPAASVPIAVVRQTR
jgi:hypothetical protein